MRTHRHTDDALTIQEVEGGFPHSEILGSKLVRSSPRLIAAYHVLHRLSAPRHPPDALTTLDHSHDPYPRLRILDHPQGSAPRDDRKDLSSDLIRRHCLPSTPGSTALRGRRWFAATLKSRSPNMLPLHDVKHPRPAPKEPTANSQNPDNRLNPTGEARDKVPQELVEPDGIEPTTSSLQS